MLDRIIQELVASFCSWRVDMGLITPPDNRPVNQASPSPTTKKMSSTTSSQSNLASSNNINSNNATSTTNAHHPQSSLEDPEYFQRIMESRYPEHMLHCPQTSLYPIFFFLMERWEARRAAAKQQQQQNVISAATATTTHSDSQNE